MFVGLLAVTHIHWVNSPTPTSGRGGNYTYIKGDLKGTCAHMDNKIEVTPVKAQ